MQHDFFYSQKEGSIICNNRKDRKNRKGDVNENSKNNKQKDLSQVKQDYFTFFKDYCLQFDCSAPFSLSVLLEHKCYGV